MGASGKAGSQRKWEIPTIIKLIYYYLRTYTHNWSLQRFSQDYNLAVHTAYFVCVNFIHKRRVTYSLKSTPNDRFFEKFSMAILFSLRPFARNLFISSFCWKHLTCGLNRGLTSNIIYYLLDYGVFFFQLVLILWIVIHSSCLIWQIISFILPPNEYDCVYAWITLGSGLAIDLQKMPILTQKKNHLFRRSSFWS